MEGRNKSAILTKRSYLEDDIKRNDDHENTKQYEIPLKTKNGTKDLKQTE